MRLSRAYFGLPFATLAVVATVVSSSSLAATYYVAPSGNDSNPGTQQSPWKTPHKPKSVLRAGDTVYFRQGDYVITEFLFLNVNGGTEAAPITYASAPGETARIVYDRRSLPPDPTTQSIVFVARPHTTFERLTLYQTPESRRVFTDFKARGISEGVAAAKGLHGIQIFASNVTVRDCRIENVAGTGIKVNHGRANTLVEGNVLTGFWEHGFYFGGVDGTFRNNRLDGSGGYSNAQGIQIQWAGTARNKVYNNIVVNGQASGVVFPGPLSATKYLITFSSIAARKRVVDMASC